MIPSARRHPNAISARDREPDLPRGDAALECRAQHLVGGAAQRGRERDRGEGEQRSRPPRRRRTVPDASGRRRRSGGGRARRAPGRRRCGRLSGRIRRYGGLRVHGHHPMMRTMTDHRPWFRVWRAGVPKTVAPFPRQSVFNLLADSAAGFPESTAIAFLGKHMNYRELLQRGGALQRRPGRPRGQAGRPRRPPPPELTAVRDRVVRVPAPRRRRRGQQPSLHAARARAPDQGSLAQRDGRPRPALPGLVGRAGRGSGP